MIFLCGVKSLFSPVKRYFNKIKQEESFIGLTIEELEKKKEILIRDNITLEIEVNNIKKIVDMLDEEYQNGESLKNEILESEIKDKKHIIDRLDRKMYDINQIRIVKEQTIAAFEIIRRNNKYIIENIDRIKNVTLACLDTAVMVAKSLYNQKLVLNKINSLKTSSEVLGSTAKILKSNEVKSQDTLKSAFDDVLKLIKDVDSQNKKSIPENKDKIIELRKIGDIYE